jgi:two-component system alkaline phosphatase synthesis response regulator PhoP
MTQVLLVEDDAHIANGLKFNLEMEGYTVTHMLDGFQARDVLFQERRAFDLIILDIMLPHLSGFDLCHALRRSHNYTPVLMLTAKNFEKDKIKGLQLGADEYITKPFSLEEVLTRIEVLLRRQAWQKQAHAVSEYHFGQVAVNFERFTVEMAGESLRLTPLELRLLKVFAENEGRVLSREELLNQVWDIQDVGSLRTVDNFVMRLRRYFEVDPAHPCHFHAVRGVGYKFTQAPTSL